MRHTVCFRSVALLTLLTLTASCVSSQLPPISASGARFKPLRDERELWKRSREEEKRLLYKNRLYEDPLLESYLQGVVTRLTPERMEANREVHYRVRVIEDPTLNAFAYPHGSIYVHTGLLARVENEDQLATVLGHEMSHVEGRHMLRFERSEHNKEIGFNVASIAAEMVVAVAVGVAEDRGHPAGAAALDVFGHLAADLTLGLAFVASVNGYGRGLETEADAGGFAKLSAAGYRLGEAPKVYEALKEDYGEPKKTEAFFFGNHPRLSERIENSKRYAGTHTAAQATDRKPIDPDLFARRIRPVVREDARLNSQAGRLKIAEAELTKALAWMPEDPVTHLYLGRLRLAQAASAVLEENGKDEAAERRLRAEAGDAFREAVRLGPDLPDAHRDLGHYLFEERDYDHACGELRRYLDAIGPADPDRADSAEASGLAEDTERIEGIVRQLRQDGHCG